MRKIIAMGLKIFVYFVVMLCKTMTGNDYVLPISENIGYDSKCVSYLFLELIAGITSFVLSTFLDRLAY